MRGFGRSSGVPDVVRAAVRGRLLAATQAEDGTWLVATRTALHAVGDEVVVLPWERVHRAEWDTDNRTLRIDEVTDYGLQVRSRTFVLPGPAQLLPLLRERVTASIVVQRRFDVEGKRGFTVIGRRNPDRDDPVAWSYEFDRGVDPADPSVLAAAEEALAEVQASLALR
jgi:hypothetical protein